MDVASHKSDWTSKLSFLVARKVFREEPFNRNSFNVQMLCFNKILDIIKLTSVMSQLGWSVNSLATGRYSCNFEWVIFKLISSIDIFSIICEIALRWMPQDLTYYWPTSVQVMAWCHLATSHYLINDDDQVLWPHMVFIGHNELNHLLLDKMATISQTVFSDAFLWMKSFVIWLKFHWYLFARFRLTITQHWFR